MSGEGTALLDDIEQELGSQAATDPANQEPAAPEVDGKILSPIFRMLADGIAPNWKIHDEECLSVGMATESYINETWGGLDNVPPWATLLLTVSMVIVPRLGIPLREPEPDEIEKTEAIE